MDKEVFKYKLTNKKYNECIDILRKDIINIFEKKIKEKDTFFSYTTTMDLYNKSKEILSEKDVKIAYRLYLLDIMDEIDEYMLDEMMQIYHELQEKTN